MVLEQLREIVGESNVVSPIDDESIRSCETIAVLAAYVPDASYVTGRFSSK
jgi:hypothetical protein